VKGWGIAPGPHTAPDTTALKVHCRTNSSLTCKETKCPTVLVKIIWITEKNKRDKKVTDIK